MPIRPRFQTRDEEAAPDHDRLRAEDGRSWTTPAAGTIDYRAYSEDRLLEERDRRRRQREELSLHPNGSPAAGSLLVTIDTDIERITDELIRRARRRHPSSGGRAG